MTQSEDWGGILHARIAQAIRTARQGKLSAQQLADETERLGYGISRSQIANYESGRKKSLDVAELVVIAAALRVPPLQLLFPDEPDDDIDTLPGQRTSTFQAKARFTGDPGLLWPGPEVTDLTEKLNRMNDFMKSDADTFAGATLVHKYRRRLRTRMSKAKEETK